MHPAGLKTGGMFPEASGTEAGEIYDQVRTD